ncbi:hypothetical protein [Bartonella apis]|uniref:hypothetical protein n=1 Tax=Bartonella apis TaxID=1686310 RepID=UPI00242F81B1|nr:hypothetical protein [Bartonella apis]MCT6825294.1 hypothetical protein [Bartonella apis]MCT6861009.1 hypothetical protein [Bartonella apis]
MTNDGMGRGSDQFGWRWLGGKNDEWIDACAKEIEAAAKKNNRSVNAEMKARFAASADSPSNSDSLDELMETLNKHDEKLDKLTDMLGRICEVINANTKRT